MENSEHNCNQCGIPIPQSLLGKPLSTNAIYGFCSVNCKRDYFWDDVIDEDREDYEPDRDDDGDYEDREDYTEDADDYKAELAAEKKEDDKHGQWEHEDAMYI